jgi:hypothetical protein
MVKVLITGYLDFGAGSFRGCVADYGQQHQDHHGKQNHDCAVIVF